MYDEATDPCAPNPGDRCRLLGNDLVEHHEPCPEGRRNGTVTDVRTGKVVAGVRAR